ncbi:MAG: DUF4932 domain-containing protein, partial [Gemmatimonadales bacterium]
RVFNRFLPVVGLVVLGACGTDLPPGTTQFTAGHIRVRTDSALDVVGVVYRLADTNLVPPRGAVRHWLITLAPHLNDSAFVAARAPGPMPVSLVLETWAAPDAPDSACGFVALGVRRCFGGNAPVRREVRRFLDVARSFAPLTAGLELMSSDERRRDLADVYVALTRGKSLDSAVASYSGYKDQTFDVTLARTLSTMNTTPPLDPARATGKSPRVFLTPDAVFPDRSYRSPNYIWLALGHQMMHEVVRKLFAEHPEILQHGWTLRPSLESEMASLGYPGLFWDDILGEQLARTIEIRMLALSSPSLTWAARADALTANTALVPYLEDVLMRYEKHRDRYPDLGAFAGELAAALDTIPLDSCRAAPSPGLGLIGVARHRAVVGWMAETSPFRSRRLVVGDTVVSVDGDSVSAGGLLTPTRQLVLAWAQHLPYELGLIDIRRGGHDYEVGAPIAWVARTQVRVASQARAPRGAELPICRWVTRALRH